MEKKEVSKTRLDWFYNILFGLPFAQFDFYLVRGKKRKQKNERCTQQNAE